jgi:L-2-hydroxycarboxylate dehydrogenase (NAD+)
MNMTEERILVDSKKLTDFTASALVKLGVMEKDAKITAKILVATDLRGVESHGVAHLYPFYAKRIRAGLINLNPKITIKSTFPSTALIEGDRGLGFVVGYHAMEEAIKRANETGAGFVAVRNSTHYGAAAYYAMMALDHNMIGFSVTHSTTSKLVVAPGSPKPVLGTNPFAVAVPAGSKPPFVLDMATSIAAGGKLEVARTLNKPIPEGWVIDAEGKPVTDPFYGLKRKIGYLPLGGSPALGAFKGFGLGVLVDILCGVLSGSCSSAVMGDDIPPEKFGSDANHFFGAIRIDSFIPLETFKKSMDEMIEAFEELPTYEGISKVYVAGGVEAQIQADRLKNGIPLPQKVVDELKTLSGELNIVYDL